MKRLVLIAACLGLCGCSFTARLTQGAVSPKPTPSPAITACASAPQNTSRIGFGVPTVQALNAVEQLTGVRAAWTLLYPEFGTAFPSAVACQYSEAGATPIIQIDPYHTTLASIAAGDYDSYLRTYALAVKAFKAPVIMSFAHEMNGNWYSWGWTHTPAAEFVGAWRRIVSIFQAEHVTNATWMWTVSLDRPGSTVAVSPAAWWPGSHYVQMVGVDAYFRYPGDTWDGVFGNILAQVRQITNDPILASETAVVPNAGSYSQTTQLFQGVEQNHLMGFVWFNENASKNWLLQDDPAALSAFKAALPQYAASS